MLFGCGGELDAVSEAGFHVVTISISEQLLSSVAERRQLDLRQLFRQGEDVFEYAKETRVAIRSLLSHLMESPYESEGTISQAMIREGLEVELVDAVFDALLESTASDSRKMARVRGRVLQEAIGLIEEQSDEPISIAEIERRTGSSTRTLRNAFHEAFGVSPKQYLQVYRLNQVRRCLRDLRGCENAVSTAANAWGFWHMGQFAADYRKMFGELPSETLLSS